MHKVPGHSRVGVTVRRTERPEEIRTNNWGPEVWKGIPSLTILNYQNKSEKIFKPSVQIYSCSSSTDLTPLGSGGKAERNQGVCLVPKISKQGSVMHL